jgi:hypothetical protein
MNDVEALRARFCEASEQGIDDAIAITIGLGDQVKIEPLSV